MKNPTNSTPITRLKLAKKILGALFLIIFLPTQVSSQWFENFEDGEKKSYAAAAVDLATGSWYLQDALLGNLSNDKFNGAQGVRMDRRDGKQGSITMLFDKNDGADVLRFLSANYGSNTDNTVQVEYSTDQGSSWTALGSPISPGSDLQAYEIDVEVSGPIRFRWIQGGDGRLNVDDVSISDYVEASDQPTLQIISNGQVIQNGQTIEFQATIEGESSVIPLDISNLGSPTLELSNIQITGDAFSVSNLVDSSLAFKQSTSLNLEFNPTSVGTYEGSFTLSSNDETHPTFQISLQAEAFGADDVLPIVDARKRSLGSRVRIAGRVTVANEFGGPLYMQDATAGIAVFYSELHEATTMGDSVIVEGPLNVFRPIAGEDSDFLLQISATSTDSDISFQVLDVEPRIPEPKVATLAEVNAGNLEAQLVKIPNTTINYSGAFQANTNYGISDLTGSAEMRVDNDTDLVGATSPTEAIAMIGVVGKFAGIYQMLPRTTSDLSVEAVSFPSDSISKDHTLDVVTWNIEWFGDANNGPENDQTQLQNVKTVIETMDADLYALQEISNSILFQDLVNSLEGYDGVLASFDQAQRTAYIYKSETMKVYQSQLVSTGMNSSDWAAGRFPFELYLDAKINGETREMYVYNIHAKAFGEQTDYNQRINASRQLKLFLDNQRRDAHVLVMGDFNDEILQSTYNDLSSPYANFDNDPEYTIITKSLEEKGYTSYSRYSMLDHIMMSSELEDEFLEGTQRIENPNYIGSFLSETSDHYPVWTRFQYGTPTSTIEDLGVSNNPMGFKLDQNYPNPFNPSTTISYTLERASTVKLQVFDIMGRKMIDVSLGVQSEGKQSHQIDASGWASGMYIYSIEVDQQRLTKSMMLLK